MSPGLVLIEKMAVSVSSEHTELEQESGAPFACESSALRVGGSAATAASVLVSSDARVSLCTAGSASASAQTWAHQCWLCLPGPIQMIGGISHLGAT